MSVVSFLREFSELPLGVQIFVLIFATCFVLVRLAWVLLQAFLVGAATKAGERLVGTLDDHSEGA